MPRTTSGQSNDSRGYRIGGSGSFFVSHNPTYPRAKNNCLPSLGIIRPSWGGGGSGKPSRRLMCGTRGRVSNFEAPQTLIYLPNQCYARKQQQAKMDAWALRGGPTGMYRTHRVLLIDGHRQPKRDPKKNRTNPPSTFCPSWHPRFGFERGGEEERTEEKKNHEVSSQVDAGNQSTWLFPEVFFPRKRSEKKKKRRRAPSLLPKSMQ